MNGFGQPKKKRAKVREECTSCFKSFRSKLDDKRTYKNDGISKPINDLLRQLLEECKDLLR